jgi:GNAT superfamily N-acetyltransferase
MPKDKNHELDFTIRRLWLADFAGLRQHLKRLDADARHARFGHAVADEFIDSYVDTAHRLGTAIFGAHVDGVLRGVAELRAIGAGIDGAAEGAITVETGFQDRGIGTALMARLVEAASNRGFPNLYMICLKDNARMRHIAHNAGARLSYEAGDITGHLSPPVPSPATIFAEYVHETSDFVLALFDHSKLKLEPSAR